MPTVRLSFTAAPQYVRTARLVGVAVARRAGVSEEVLDEVRLAVGEACARAVARHRRGGVPDPVQVEMSDDGPYTVRVIDAGGPSETDDPDADDRMAERVLAGLVHDLRVEGGEVSMVWPVRRRPAHL
jgi:anti-sigma regulatory factor (Ser/Thr protein kinase)